MSDCCILVRRLLLATPAFVTALGSGKVAVGVLPEGIDPSVNPSVVLTANGGAPSAEILEMAHQRIQVRVWAGQNQQTVARTLYKALRSAIHGAQNQDFSTDGYLYSCVEVVAGQDVTDPDNGWATLVAFYNAISR